jgi:hypothetical protein
MHINQLLPLAEAARVRMTLDDGQTFVGRFRADILTPSALAVYFHGEERDLSLPIDLITDVEVIAG